jgi:hypothetical protein
VASAIIMTLLAMLTVCRLLNVDEELAVDAAGGGSVELHGLAER